MIAVPTAPWVHTVFDLLAWSAGSATTFALYRWRLRAVVGAVARRVGGAYFAALATGAAGGAWLAGSLNTLRSDIPTISHSIAGALAGGIVAVELYKAVRGIRGSTGGLFVGSIAAGIAVGRWGCFFAGLPDDTYGTPTSLPWAVDLGDGVGRHPVQLYESFAMLAFLGCYMLGLRGRRPWAMRRGFYALCGWYGLQRFAWEFIKPYPPLFGLFNVFHLICAGLVAYACLYAADDWRRERAGPGRGALPLPGPDHEPV